MLPELYLITDRHQVQPGHQLLETLEALLRAGVRMIQLREKDLSAAALYPLARDVRALTKQYQSLLLVNDRIDLAQAIGADGVHLGHHSLPIEVARRILGSDVLIGASTHGASEVESACRQGADFVTYGPVFFTPSKASYGEPVGLESLRTACTISTVPVFALGGIDASNAPQARQAGAHGVAMISALMAAPSPNQAFGRLVQSMQTVK